MFRKDLRALRQRGGTPAIKRKEPKPRVVLPFLPELYNRMKRTFSKAGVEVSLRPPPSLKGALLKKKPASIEPRGLVYRIPCQDCDWSYVGETARTLSVRVSEHKRAVRNLSTSSEIANHSFHLDHRINWEAAEILDREPNCQKRLFKEAWHSRVYKSGNRVFESVDDAWASLA